MKDLARSLCDYWIDTYGDVALVTPAGFATALRIVGNVPDDATPLWIERWIGRLGGTVLVGKADASVAGFQYSLGEGFVIETGRGRSSAERNITIPHEFGERLQRQINEELAQRGLASFECADRYWDAMGAALVEPLAPFRRAAQQNGLDVVDLQDPLSFEAVIRRLKEAFDDDVPLFAVYYRRDGWKGGTTFAGDSWPVARSAWTTKWFGYGYRGGQERLYVPRPGDKRGEGSFVAAVCRTRRSLLVHTRDQVAGRIIETDVLLRLRSYGREPAQVFAVGVEQRYGHMLAAQLALVAPEERHGRFDQLF